METEPNMPQLPGALSLLKPSWRAVRTNLEAFTVQITMPFVVVALGAALFILGQRLALHYVWEAIGGLTLVAGFVLLLALVPTLVYTQLKSVQGQHLGYVEILREAPSYFWRMWLLLVCLTILISGGFLLLIVPGLFAWQRFMYAPYLLIDKQLSVYDALWQSSAIAKQYSRETWAVVGAQLLIEAPGMIVPLFGSLVSTIFGIAYFCAPAVRYIQTQELTERTELITEEKSKSATTNSSSKSKIKTQSRTKKRS
jgi:hypothetical protein